MQTHSYSELVLTISYPDYDHRHTHFALVCNISLAQLTSYSASCTVEEIFELRCMGVKEALKEISNHELVCQ